MEWWEIVIRIALSIFVGAAIGIERERRSRPAGMRTHVLVCMGAATIALVEYCTVQGVILMPLGERTGISVNWGRMTAQVISGIGFLGAGTIFTARKKIAGLTTAASLWNSACLGIAVGYGYYLIAILGCILVIAVLVTMQKVIHVNASKKVEVRFVHRVETIDFINRFFDEKGIKVLDVDFTVDNTSDGTNLYTNIYELHLPREITYRDLVITLSEQPNVRSVRTTNT